MAGLATPMESDSDAVRADVQIDFLIRSSLNLIAGAMESTFLAATVAAVAWLGWR